MTAPYRPEFVEVRGVPVTRRRPTSAGATEVMACPWCGRDIEYAIEDPSAVCEACGARSSPFRLLARPPSLIEAMASSAVGWATLASLAARRLGLLAFPIVMIVAVLGVVVQSIRRAA